MRTPGTTPPCAPPHRVPHCCSPPLPPPYRDSPAPPAEMASLDSLASRDPQALQDLQASAE